ncbi:SHOCT domain-containing protein [Halobellus sp. Atlit-38R]|uniref:SHOCT domain-containing protein n=1 Tax=Halobellus sp. Atlit-38R TaxID=2282131 RepID=UPI000EF2277E|nr:SHOCT domain-containing protein [Halobellus sp. Atlit-38R]RLM90998.1 SHOCT domain-containing protein [Halobellus sp. Atlit-38R]
MDDRRDRLDRAGLGPADSDDPVVAATALVVLGAGLGSLFGVPLLAAVDFWLVFVVGYAAVVPLVSLARSRQRAEAETDSSTPRTDRVEQSDGTVGGDQWNGADGGVDAALDRLRDRYARGDLSEEQFERKLEVLLETDTPENARERIEQGGPQGRGQEHDRSQRGDGRERERNGPETERAP